jgi:long-chain acyl-CoA synthetase
MANITSEELAEAVAGQTVATEFLKTVERCRDQVALRDRAEDGSWREWTYGDMADQVARAAGALQSIGVAPGDRVVLMMRNISLFHILDVATIFCGATPISIYNSSSPEQVAYLAGHCEAKTAIVENAGFLERFLKVRDELPALEHLAILDDPDGVAGSDVAAGQELLEGDPVDLHEAAGLVTPEALATVIYTSGTTGPPKGVMISHFNVTWTAESLRRSFGGDADMTGYRLVSYLPMAHIAERMTSHYSMLVQGYEVTSLPEVSGLAEYLREVRPNVLFGVPRVWEKIHAGVMAAAAADPDQDAKFKEGIEAAKPIAHARDWGDSTPEQDATWDFLQEVAFRPVREMIGLDQLEFGITGAAPITPDLLEWYQALGVPLSEIYGMSESSGPMTWTPRRLKIGTVGPAIPGCAVKLADDGEIVCKGGNVFGGYLNDPEKTAEALDDDGWLHTGDIGEVDDDGYYRIVDRKKELIITAGGKNISPANLEAALKAIPLVGQACAIGDKRPFVSALIVLDPEVAPAWARQHGIEFDSVADLATDERVVKEVEAGVRDVMKQFNNAEAVKKVTILPDEWQPDSEELTPTSKLKRRGIHAKYADEIEALYS